MLEVIGELALVREAGVRGDLRQGEVAFQTAPHLLEVDTYHTYVEINPAEGAELLTCDILLDPGRMPRGTLVGPDGKPLVGARALGLTAYNRWRHWTQAPLKSADFT